MAKAQKRKFVSPAGEAVYPYLNRPDTADIDGQPQRPAFKCRLRIDSDNKAGTIQNGKPTAETLRQLIDRLVDEAWDEREDSIPAKYKKVAEKVYPYEEEVDGAGEPTGTLLFNFKQNAELALKDGSVAKVKIDLFDAKRKRTTSNIGGGSKLKIAFTHRTYGMVSGKQYNVGISLDFSGVQILELVEFGGGSADSYGFGDEDYDGIDSAPSDSGDMSHHDHDEEGEEDDF